MFCVLLLILLLFTWCPVALGEQSVDELPDLTAGVVPIVTYKVRDPFSSGDLTSVGHIEYLIQVKNQTGDPLIADSLILVIDRIVEISGQEISDQIEVVGAHGQTAEGKPYFRIPTGDKLELAPYAASESFVLELDNPNYLRFFPPMLQVRGLRRTESETVQGLLETLVEKGLLTSEEAERALESTPLSPASER